MRRQLFHIWLAASAGGCLVLGCHHHARHCPYPEEPLLLSNPPVEGKIEVLDGPRLSRSEPAAPPRPEEALASIARPLPVGPAEPVVVMPTPEPPRAATAPANEPGPQTAAPPTVPAAPAVLRKSPLQATPASRTRETPAPRPAAGPELTPPAPPQARTVPGVYGHDASYVWLQGPIDKHYRGRLYLRYCDPTVEDRWGGKVCLEDDPRLAEFKDEDVVFVEGELANDPNSAPRDGWRQYPHYRVKSVRLVQRKN